MLAAKLTLILAGVIAAAGLASPPAAAATRARTTRADAHQVAPPRLFSTRSNNVSISF